MRAMLLVFVVGCTKPPNEAQIFSSTPCGSAWGAVASGATCDPPCENAPTADGAACSTTEAWDPQTDELVGSSSTCAATFRYDGTHGCCVTEMATMGSSQQLASASYVQCTD